MGGGSCEKCYVCEELEGAVRNVMCVRIGWGSCEKCYVCEEWVVEL